MPATREAAEAQAEVEVAAAREAMARTVARSMGCLVVEPVMEGGRMRPAILEMGRRLTTVCHTPSGFADVYATTLS